MKRWVICYVAFLPLLLGGIWQVGAGTLYNPATCFSTTTNPSGDLFLGGLGQVEAGTLYNPATSFSTTTNPSGVLFLGGLGQVGAGTLYNPATSFSTTTNPSGVLLLGGLGQVGAGTLYNPATSFSTTNNPSGVWSYGWSESLGSAFVIATRFQLTQEVQQWLSDVAADGNPSISHNGTGDAIVFGGSILLPPGSLMQHPGPGGECALVRFTAPHSGDYMVAGNFSGLDFIGPTTSDVHILVNGASKFDGLVNDFGPTKAVPFLMTLPLVSGDTVDFAVGTGANGTYFNDATGLDVTITEISGDYMVAGIFPDLDIIGQTTSDDQILVSSFGTVAAVPFPMNSPLVSGGGGGSPGGSGTNGTRFNDPTGPDVTTTKISTMPEPGTLTLCFIGIASIVGYGWRRRRVQRLIVAGRSTRDYLHDA